MAIEKAPGSETNQAPVKTSDSEEKVSVAEKTSVEQYVQYVGPASRREITVEDWAGIGVKMPKDSNWTFGNGFKLPKKDFPPAALEYLLQETRSTGGKSFVLTN